MLSHSYDYRLVALSVCIAVLASYAALDLAGRVTSARGRARLLWLTGGAIAMGIGIWSMHYIGMLAFRLPVPVRYDWPTVLVSLAAAVLASAVALFVVSRREMGVARALLGSLFMGGGIAAMHYTGMAAMRLDALCHYSAGLVSLSVVLAIVISFVALWLAFLLRAETMAWTWRKAVSAAVMGAAIPIMHYTGMAAAHFAPAAIMQPDVSHAVGVSALSVAGITTVTLMVLAIVVLSALADRRFSLQAMELESSRRHRRIIETALDAFVAMDAAGLVTDWNVQAERTFGWSREEATGQLLADLAIPPRYRAAHAQGLQKYLATGDGPLLNKRIEITALHRDGHEFPIELAICPIEWSEKQHFGAFIRDVTDRIRSERELVQKMDELREREEQLSSIYNTVADAIFRLVSSGDGQLRFHSVNEAFLSMTGYRREQVIGRLVREVMPESSLPLVLEKHQEAIRLRAVVRWEETSTYPTGPVTGEVSVAPALDQAGNCAALIGAIHDITKRVSAEEQLRQAQKMEGIGRLAGGIAHDFNNILTTITGYSEMILDQIGPDTPISADLREIRLASDRAASLTRQLLAFGRRQVLHMAPVDVNQVIKDTERMLQRLIGEDIEISLALTNEPWSIVADRTQLEQVLVNVAANARDAMPYGGQFTAETALADSDEIVVLTGLSVTPGRYIRLRMSDTGTGMDAHTRERLFEPFFTTKELGRGTGLGLATVYGIVKQLGGYIWVSSEVGQGTTFTLYFPAVAVEVERITPVRRISAASVPEARRVVLVVEDEPGVRLLVGRTLRRHGYLVLEAADGADGLEQAAQHERIDLILSDVVMPKMDGPEMVRRLRETNAELKVLYMSGYAGETVVKRGGLGTDTQLLEKPFTAHGLLSAVRARLEEDTAATIGDGEEC